MTRSSQDPDPPEHAVDRVDPPPAEGGDPTGYVDGVPTLDFVRDRIESRYATAMGATELADESEAGRSLAQQEEDREAAAKARLDEIRKSLHRE